MIASRPTATLAYSVRRDEPTRLEGFSDAVFGFSLTLLAFSLEVPGSIADLRDLVVAQLVPTLAAFALMCWIWAEHNAFFRQFGLQDGTTIVLNSALLFLVVFYTYPLKFMAVFLWGLVAHGMGWTGIVAALERSGSLAAVGITRDLDVTTLMVIYNGGFIALFGIFALLYGHAWRQRDALELDPLARFDARSGLRVQLHSVAIGGLAMVVLAALTVAVPYLAGLSGLTYMLMGPVHGIYGTRRARLRQALHAVPPDAPHTPLADGPPEQQSR